MGFYDFLPFSCLFTVYKYRAVYKPIGVLSLIARAKFQKMPRASDWRFGFKNRRLIGCSLENFQNINVNKISLQINKNRRLSIDIDIHNSSFQLRCLIIAQ